MKTIKIILALLLSTCLLFTNSLGIKAVESDSTLDVEILGIKTRYIETLVGNPTLNADAAISPKVKAIQSNAQKALDAYIAPDVRTTSIFKGDDISRDAMINASNSDALNRTSKSINAIALAYQTFGTTMYHDDATKSLLLETIDSFGTEFNSYKDYKPGELLFGNWWNWEIGVPSSMSSTLVLLENEIKEYKPSLITEYIGAFDNYLRNGKDGDVDLTARQHTGTNLADITINRILQGTISNDTQRIQTSVDNLMSVFAQIDPNNIINNNTDGVYADGSFIQHHRVAYTGTYGKGLLQRATQAIVLLSGTRWQPTDQLSTIQNWIYNSFSPVMFEGYMMEIVKGRGVSRTATGYSDSIGILESLVTISQYLEPADALKMQSHLKYIVQSQPTAIATSSLGISVIIPYLAIMNNSDIPAVSSTAQTHYAFNAMEKNVHIRNDYAFSIARSSNRISKYEYMSGENLKAWFQGDGAFYLYQSGRDQTASYGANYFATIDPYKLPGTTTPQEERKTIVEHYGGFFYPGYAAGSEEQNDYVYFPVGTNKFSGSAALNNYASVGMQLGDENAYAAKQAGILGEDFTSAYKNADANKSWFLFDDEIVVMGSGINDEKGRSVTTTIDNRMSNTNEDTTLIAGDTDGNENNITSKQVLNTTWANYKNNSDGTSVGYYFPSNSDVTFVKESRSGDLHDIRSATPSKLVTQNYSTLSFEHGQDPKDASYAYIMLPNASAEETKAYKDTSSIEILSNTKNTHAVFNKNLNTKGYNFFTTAAERIEDFSALSPASIMSSQDGSHLTLSISDPTNSQSSITLRFYDQRIATQQNNIQIVDHDTYTDVIVPVESLNGAYQTLNMTSSKIEDNTTPTEPQKPTTPVEPNDTDSKNENISTGVQKDATAMYIALFSSLIALVSVTYYFKKKKDAK